MFAILLLHIIITLTSLLTGFLFYHYVVNDRFYEQSNTYRPVIFYLITGLIIMTLITQFFILFLPVTFAYKFIIASLLVVAVVITRNRIIPLFLFLLNKHKTLGIPVQLVFIVTWLLILVLNAGSTMMDDTESYHIQMVKWIQEYGTVPGLANLHGRFGFNSSWFSSIALFSFECKGYNFYTALNGVLTVWFAGYLLDITGKSLKKENNLQRWQSPVHHFFVFIMALISWPIIRGNPATANYDFITLLITFVLFSETLRASIRTKKFSFYCEWIIWPIFLFTVRIINLPFLLLSTFSFILLFKHKNWNKVALYLLCCILFIIPFLTRNIIVSGYAFYPSLYFDWWAVDWKADKEKTIELLHFIKYYNRVSTGVQDLNVTESLGEIGWVIEWFKYMLTYNKILFIPGIAGIILLPFLIQKKRSLSVPLPVQIFLLTVILQIVFWFFFAPDPRFIYGCLFIGILLLFILLVKSTVDQYFTVFQNYTLIVTALVISAFVFYKISSMGYRNWILPAKLPLPPVKNITIDNIQLHIPEKVLNNWNPRCYATELPCLYEADSRLHLRGDKISKGFRLKE